MQPRQRSAAYAELLVTLSEAEAQGSSVAPDDGTLISTSISTNESINKRSGAIMYVSEQWKDLRLFEELLVLENVRLDELRVDTM